MVFEELESFAAARGFNDSIDDGGVSRRVLSTLLNEIDGISDRKGVIVVGCTSRPDMIDSALLRPGRFDVKVYVPPPQLSDRTAILRLIAQKTPLRADVQIEWMAQQTEGFTCGGLWALVREAALRQLQMDMESRGVSSAAIESVLDGDTRLLQVRSDDVARFQAFLLQT